MSAAALSALLFVLGCAQPALVLHNTGTGKEESLWGMAILLTGWLGVFVMQMGWFANPLLLLTLLLLLMGRYRGAYWAGVVTVLVGLSTLSWYLNPIPADEGGSPDRQLELLHPTLGYFFWMGSLLVGPATAVILGRKEPMRHDNAALQGVTGLGAGGDPPGQSR
ncbi:hypothetical protein LXT21_15120 [Myxococcus sp. K38C18041901]|uniref:hypothetical protein n=1 Tax=Myxococcus guangdongensis TaxID=2906760 RepID=UPI0020A7E462|nr:hypothetical protein [Myxococcus guangdongensis]MCP3060113.1 hypothetical protein [Myxococcus guangdongensis]